MARFVEVLLVLFFLAKVNAVNSACTDEQFTCKSSGKCIPIDNQCDGISDLRYEGISCEDGSDEDDCDYSSIIEVSKRIVCGYDELVDGRDNLISYENSSECLDSHEHCWWDDDSSTCYHRYPAKTGGLKCHLCSFRGLTRTDWTVECEKGDHYESCDIALAGPWLSTSTGKQACVTGIWWTGCGTVDQCASGHGFGCCTTDYCNQLTIDNSDVLETLNVDTKINKAFYDDDFADYQFNPKGTFDDKLLVRSEENDTSAEDNGSVMKLDLVAACIVVITSAIMTV